MDNKISKFIISKKCGKIIYHKTELLKRLFALQNGISRETLVKNKQLCIWEDNVITFGTSVFVNETIKGLINHTLRKINAAKNKLKIYVTPEFIKKNHQGKFSAAIKEFPEIKVNILNFSEDMLNEAINKIITNDKPNWQKVESQQKEIAYIDLESNLEYFDFFWSNFDM